MSIGFTVTAIVDVGVCGESCSRLGVGRTRSVGSGSTGMFTIIIGAPVANQTAIGVRVYASTSVFTTAG